MAAAGSTPAAAFVPQGMTEFKAQGDTIRIVTTYQFEPHELQQVLQAAPGKKVEVIYCKDRNEFRSRLKEAEVVYGGVSGGELDLAPNLKWVQSGGAGVEFLINDDKLKNSSVVLTNYARTFAPGISETGMGLLLCLTRGISKYYMPQYYKRQMKPMGTVKSDDHTELVGRTMGIVGMGGIGTELARRAYFGFDMRIVATDAKPMPKPHFVQELHDPSWFKTMVPIVDVLVAAAPHTKETERMFNEQVFRSMKRTAYFLALSRGMLFDDIALVKALKEGWIAGAGLDVFRRNLRHRSTPIFDSPNVVMSAHTSGWSPDRQVRLIDLFADNVRRYALGIPLVNVVDKLKGY